MSTSCVWSVNASFDDVFKHAYSVYVYGAQKGGERFWSSLASGYKWALILPLTLESV